MGQRATRGGDRDSNVGQQDIRNTAPTLSDIGITRDQSSRYQQLAAMPDEHFETAVETEMLRKAAEMGQRATKGRPEQMSNEATFTNTAPTLSDIGITRDQFYRAAGRGVP